MVEYSSQGTRKARMRMNFGGSCSRMCRQPLGSVLPQIQKYCEWRLRVILEMRMEFAGEKVQVTRGNEQRLVLAFGELQKSTVRVDPMIQNVVIILRGNAATKKSALCWNGMRAVAWEFGIVEVLGSARW